MDSGTGEMETLKPQQPEPIHETDEAVSYLGVRLPKAENRDGQFVPHKAQYENYINDQDLSLPLQRTYAISFLNGDPLLVEGGTSIGKTTTARKMAADLGWEVHYVNLNGATDVEDLMGRYIPNPNRTSPDDPEYIFADGKVTSGLRQEPGKIKVVVLDEFNSADPKIVIRLHEVLDALERGESVVLSEDASETVPVSKELTKILGLMNPPGRGYFGREPLDPAQLRRWVYYKAPSELPEETFTYATDALFTFAPETAADIPEEEFIESREYALSPDQLQEIPGLKDLLAKYREFHKGAKELVKGRQIAADQPQLFTYDDRMEPRRVRDFILRFYNGDINDTFQTALRYYYANKVESQEDKDKLDELIKLVHYQPVQQPSERRGLDRDAAPQNFTALPDTEITPEATATPEPRESGDIISNERNEWKKILGYEVTVPPLPDYVTDEVQRKLEDAGFGLRFMPDINLLGGSLKSKSLDGFFEDMKKVYPKWRRYETLTDAEQSDPKVSRTLQEWFWEQIKEGNIDEPKLPGKWMAVETIKKPSWGGTYEPSVVGTKLGFPTDRFRTSWNDVTAAIGREKHGLLVDLGITTSKADVRLLETVEWNLLANREGWGETDTYEWTNTEYRSGGDSRRVVTGHSDDGGAAGVVWVSPHASYVGVGWRVAAVLGS